MIVEQWVSQAAWGKTQIVSLSVIRHNICPAADVRTCCLTVVTSWEQNPLASAKGVILSVFPADRSDHEKVFQRCPGCGSNRGGLI